MTLRAAGDWIDYEITFLEMTSPPASPPRALPNGAVLENVGPPGDALLLSFYTRVGEAYEWTDMLHRPAEERAAYASDPGREMHILRLPDGQEGGFFLLDFTEMPVADLGYFGLLPAALGGGYGRALLEQAVALLWAREGVSTVTVNTCTLDHPRALPLYKSVGFRPVRRVWAQRQLTRPREISMRKAP